MERFASARNLGCLRRVSCLRRSPVRINGRRFQSDIVPPIKPYYVTSPIFYVNADPHIGHLYSVVLADVLKRWQVLEGRHALLCTGTDEHGLKVQQAAARAGAPPKQFCDENAAVFAELARRADIDSDFFIRTTDADHIAAVRAIWRRLRRRGFIYTSQHKGWYCVSDETFYPESLIEKRINPSTGKAEMVSVETGKTVEWTEERNYHFRMTAVRDRLLQFYEENPDFVKPAPRMAEVVQWVTHQLEDLSISRPASRLAWAVPVPEDETQTVYVWVDALVNYITKAGYPERWAPEEKAEETAAAARGESDMGGRGLGAASTLAEAASSASSPTASAALTHEQLRRQQGGGWPADVHVIGKDIVRFHGVYWPALLLALDLPLPRHLLSHAHWTLGRKKMSKSVGNVVNPFYAMDRFGVDAMRYYLVHDGGIEDDSDYGNEHIVERYKKGLQGGLGNLLGRVTRTSRWQVREAVAREGGWEVLAEVGAHDTAMQEQIEAVSQVGRLAAGQMAEINPRAALRTLMDVVYQTNKFVSDTAPWTLAKELAADGGKDQEKKLRLEQIVYLSAEALRVVGILLQPFMPTKAAEVLDVLGVDPKRRMFLDAKLGVDTDYGVPLRAPGKGKEDGLFPPLPVED